MLLIIFGQQSASTVVQKLQLQNYRKVAEVAKDNHKSLIIGADAF